MASEEGKVEIKPFVFGADASQGGFVFAPLSNVGASTDASAELTDEQAKEEAEREADVYFEPVVRLQTVETSNGEENEKAIFDMRAKLFRFDKKEKEWKERGVGDVRFMEHKESHKIRILLRQDKTLKVRLNHYVVPGLELSECFGSDRAWMWNCPMDYSEEEPQPDIFAIRFKNHENALKFKDAFEDAIEKNSKLMNLKKENDEEAKEEEKKEEEKKEEKEEKEEK